MLLPNLPPPEEGIRHRQLNTQAFINQETLGTGTLYIAESRVSWAKDGEAHSLSLEYPHIAIHAVSRDNGTFPHPCLYLMIDTTLNHPAGIHSAVNTMNGDGASDSDSDDEDNDETAMTEVRFVPGDAMSLEPMYKALNECQALHPDPEDQQSEDEGWPADDDEDEGEYELSENGHAPGTFDDMEEDVGQPRVGPRVLPNPPNQDPAGGNFEEEEEEAMETGQFDDADM